MDFQHAIITGGAGFVGSNLAISFRRAFPDLRVTAVDSLKRRGSELNVPRVQAHGVRFVHGDVRCWEDLEGLATSDLVIDCSAEPSVQAGLHTSPRGVLAANLSGTINCLELARLHDAAFLFLSTSRVYPLQRLNDLPYVETESRFQWQSAEGIPGFSTAGIAEAFPLDGVRSFYGASKLACELLIQEYVYSYGVAALVNRCGVLAGPWQMGKVDQGVVTLWLARHFFGQPLRYIGFGGQGKQVRDVLHIDDLFELLVRQLADMACWDGRVYNVGGGVGGSISLRELTELCRQLAGRVVPITAELETSPVDVRLFVTDARRAERDFNWQPQHSLPQLLEDILRWLREHQASLQQILG